MRSLVLALDRCFGEDVDNVMLPTLLCDPIMNLLHHVQMEVSAPWLHGALAEYRQAVFTTESNNNEKPSVGLLTLQAWGLVAVQSYDKYDDPGKKRHLKGCFEDNWNKSLGYALQAKKSLNVLFDYLLARKPAFRNRDLESPSWTRTWQMFMKKYALLWFFGLATKWLKYQIAAIFARTAEQELPAGLEGEKPGMFLTGVGYVFLHQLSHDHTSHGLDLAHNLLMCKKGLPPVNPRELIIATEDCRRTLTGTRQEQIINIFTNGPTDGPDEVRSHKSGCTCSEEYLVFDEVRNCVRTFNRKCTKCSCLSVVPSAPVEYPPDLPSEDPITMSDYKKLTYKARLGHLVTQTRRTALELFGNQKYHVGNIGIPSLKAHYEMPKVSLKEGGGGAYGLIVKEWQSFYSAKFEKNGNYGRRREPVLVYPRQKELCKWCNCGRFVGPNGLTCAHDWNIARVWENQRNYVTGWCSSHYYDSAGSDRSLAAPERKYAQGGLVFCDDHNESISIDACSRLQDALREFFASLVARSLKTQNVVEPVALPEPLKVRVITKGPYVRYFVGKCIQQATWGILSKHPCFLPIGQPLTSEMLEERLGPLYGDEVYQSADYKSATDYLHPDLSATAAFEIGSLLGLDHDLIQLYVDGLTNSWIAGAGPQKWGQLMGSPLSFPILCLLNATLNRFFLEMVSGKTRLLNECPMLINGDDLAMKIKKIDYEDWKSLVTDGGLVPSIGKNYVSKKFVIMNSTFYEYLGENVMGGANFQKRPYVNLALVTPTFSPKESRALKGKVSLDPNLKDLSQLSHKAIEGFDCHFQDWIMSKFLGWAPVKEIIRKTPGRVSYYADKSLGGLGLPITRDNLMTPEQLGYYTRVAGLQGIDHPSYNPTCDIGGGAGWNLLKLVPQKRLWGDWFLPSQRFSVPVPNLDLWKAALKDPEPCKINERIAECRMLNLDVDIELFRPHRVPWPARTLAKMPWNFCTFEDSHNTYGCASAWVGCEDSDISANRR